MGFVALLHHISCQNIDNTWTVAIARYLLGWPTSSDELQCAVTLGLHALRSYADAGNGIYALADTSDSCRLFEQAIRSLS